MWHLLLIGGLPIGRIDGLPPCLRVLPRVETGPCGRINPGYEIESPSKCPALSLGVGAGVLACPRALLGTCSSCIYPHAMERPDQR